jgi:arsenate reductase (thioredoxin)
MEKRSVLFICTGNSARSQMAEGLVNHLLGDQWHARSAGTQPAGAVHPLAVQVMAELGIDIAAQAPKSTDVFRETAFDLVATVCDAAAESCPLWLGGGRVMHVGFPDPAAAIGTEQERLAAFRSVRDAISRRVSDALREQAAAVRE